jgi:hypothetical protein
LNWGTTLRILGWSSMNFRMDFYTMMVINSRGMGLMTINHLGGQLHIQWACGSSDILAVQRSCI